MKNIVNLTPRAITLMRYDGTIISKIEPSGIVARVFERTWDTGEMIGEIPITENTYDYVWNLPEPEEGTVYIVSAVVTGRCRERCDVFVPNESVTDVNGKVVGYLSLARL